MVQKTQSLNLCEFQSKDLDEVIKLFHETVHAINARDYSPEQLDAMAPKVPNRDRWHQKLLHNYTIVAETDHLIVGFGDLTKDGVIDHLYTHKDFQGKGIGKLILGHLEQKARTLGLQHVKMEASITARPFFERWGYRVLSAKEKLYNGQRFLIYSMEKIL